MQCSYSDAVARCAERSDVDPQKRIITYSEMQKFWACPRACKYRYIDELVPLHSKDDNLYLGTLVHEGLEAWHNCMKGDDASQKEIAQSRANDAIHKKFNEYYDASPQLLWQALAIIDGYDKAYRGEASRYRTIATEQFFCVPLDGWIPDELAARYQFAMKMDRLVYEIDTGYIFLGENKTASVIDEAYIDKLYMDKQIALYSLALERATGITPNGVIYDVMEKPTNAFTEQRKGETDEEYAARRAVAKRSKQIKRKLAESDEEYSARLCKWHSDATHYQRIPIFLDSYCKESALQDFVWGVEDFDSALQRNRWGRRTARCYDYYRTCAYKPLCNTGNNMLIQMNYKQRAAHEELASNLLS